MYTVQIPAIFERRADRFFRKHPQLRENLADLVIDLQQDPFQPHLRLHKLTGRLDHLYAVRLTYSPRVTLILVVSEESITLVDIGGHDDVYHG